MYSPQMELQPRTRHQNSQFMTRSVPLQNLRTYTANAGDAFLKKITLKTLRWNDGSFFISGVDCYIHFLIWQRAAREVLLDIA